MQACFEWLHIPENFQRDPKFDVLLEYQLNKRISYIEGRGLTSINKAKEDRFK